MKTLTPSGVQDLLPNQTKIYRGLLDTIQSVFSRYDFNLVRTPSLEYIETLAPGLPEQLLKKAVTFQDPSGQQLVLRPDHTTPIARMVATRPELEFPQKLSYQNNIFRKESRLLDQDLEMFQAGIEYIGGSGPEADARVIEICIETIKALGYKNFIIDIGHKRFIDELDPIRKKALLEEDLVTFGSIPLRGKKDVIKGDSDLEKIYTILEEKGLDSYIFFNKGLAKDSGYYTGIVFECSIEGIRHKVATGGRYDDLMGRFGRPAPAVGFAIQVNYCYQDKVKGKSND